MSTLRYLFFTLVTFLLLHIHKMFHERHQRTTNSAEVQHARREGAGKEETRKTDEKTKKRHEAATNTRRKKLNTKEKNVGYNFKSPIGVWLCVSVRARSKEPAHEDANQECERDERDHEKEICLIGGANV